MTKIDRVLKYSLEEKSLGKIKPKSFLYSGGGGYVPAGLEHHAHYLKTGSIIYMTGKTHDKSSVIINPVDELEVEDDRQKYQVLTNDFNFVNPIKSGKQIPLPVDYDNGFFERFFAKKVGEKVPFEIKKIFMHIDPLYTYYTLSWKLTGNRFDVMRANSGIVLLADKKFKGLKVLINNYIKYYK
jgi:hypothetical protein